MVNNHADKLDLSAARLALPADSGWKAEAIIDGYAAGKNPNKIQKELRDQLPAAGKSPSQMGREWVVGEKLLRIFREELERNLEFQQSMARYTESRQELALLAPGLRRRFKESSVQRQKNALVQHLEAKLKL